MKIIKENTFEEGINNKTLKETLISMCELCNKHLDDNNIYIVHHLNGNNLDNRISNLALIERGDHTRYHSKLRQNNIDINSLQAKNLLDTYDVVRIGELINNLIVKIKNTTDDTEI